MLDRTTHTIEGTTALQFDLVSQNALLRERGFTLVPTDQMSELHAFADTVIPGDIASISTMTRVQTRTGGSLYLKRDEGRPVALVAGIPLTASGEAALRKGQFGYDDHRADWMARPGETCPAVLIWGLAGDRPADRLGAIRAFLDCWAGTYAGKRVYSRARSPEGQSIMRRLGFRPAQGAIEGLSVRPTPPPLLARRASKELVS